MGKTVVMKLCAIQSLVQLGESSVLGESSMVRLQERKTMEPNKQPEAVRKSAIAKNTSIALATVRTSFHSRKVKMIRKLPIMDATEERMVVIAVCRGIKLWCVVMFPQESSAPTNMLLCSCSWKASPTTPISSKGAARLKTVQVTCLIALEQVGG